MGDNYINPGCTVDLIVPCNEGIVLIKRKHDPFKDHWALPGGFLDMDKESLEEAGARELFEETNLSADTDDLRLVGVYSKPKRDPRGHVVSHAYEVRKWSGKLRANDDAAKARVFTFAEIPHIKLAFDHNDILRDYLDWKNMEGLE